MLSEREAGDSAEHDRLIATAQSRRDRDRLVALQADVVMLKDRVAALERSPSRRLFAPARRVLAMASGLRNRAQHPAVAPPSRGLGRGFVLVIDDNWPQPDRDSGSVDIVALMHGLGRLGFDAVLAAIKQHDGEQQARNRLSLQGIRCIGPSDAQNVEQFLIKRGATLDLVVLCRVYCGGEFLELAQRHCQKARLVFNSIDLNYVREERRARLQGDERLLAMIDQIRGREEHIVRNCDATMVVSEAEEELLARTVPKALAVAMPLARPVQPPAAPFAARRDIGFIGGFAHVPNVDAVRHLLDDIWPSLSLAVPDCTLSIVGADAPSVLLARQDGRVRFLGHVPDIGPWFETLRLTVAPLRFGAGAKGKVASSLAAGVPCVASPIAAEGMALGEEAGVLVASTPAEFVAASSRAYGDGPTWDRLSTAAVEYARRVLSPEAWQDRLDAMLIRIGL